MDFRIGHVAIKAIAIFTCSRCGRRGQGDTVRREAGGLWATLSELPDVAGDLLSNVSNACIPVGWSSHGRGDVRCPDCEGTAKEAT